MYVEKVFADLLAEQAAAKNHHELLEVIVNKEVYDPKLSIFAKIELLNKIKN